MERGWRGKNMMALNGGRIKASLSIIHNTNRTVAHGGVRVPSAEQTAMLPK